MFKIETFQFHYSHEIQGVNLYIDIFKKMTFPASIGPAGNSIQTDWILTFKILILIS